MLALLVACLALLVSLPTPSSAQLTGDVDVDRLKEEAAE